jgi:hypothetical protein
VHVQSCSAGYTGQLLGECGHDHFYDSRHDCFPLGRRSLNFLCGVAALAGHCIEPGERGARIEEAKSLGARLDRDISAANAHSTGLWRRQQRWRWWRRTPRHASRHIQDHRHRCVFRYTTRCRPERAGDSRRTLRWRAGRRRASCFGCFVRSIFHSSGFHSITLQSIYDRFCL